MGKNSQVSFECDCGSDCVARQGATHGLCSACGEWSRVPKKKATQTAQDVQGSVAKASTDFANVLSLEGPLSSNSGSLTT